MRLREFSAWLDKLNMNELLWLQEFITDKMDKRMGLQQPDFRGLKGEIDGKANSTPSA